MVGFPNSSRRLRDASLATGALTLLAACNVVAMQQSRYTRQLIDVGLTTTTATFGADTVRYWEGGRGKPVLFLHGMGADALWQWHDQAAAVAAGHRVVMPDLLWFGGSSSTDADYSLDHQVRAIVSLLDRLGEAQVDVVGLSYGGLVALQLAVVHPTRVRRLVIVDSPGTAYTEADHAAALKRLGVNSLEELLVPDGPADVQDLLALAYSSPPYIPDFAARQIADDMTAQHREEKVALLRWVTTNMTELKAKASGPTQPTLLIWGDGDPLFPLAVGRRLATTWSARLEVIGRARHAPNIEYPDLFNRVLIPFLD